MCACVYSCVCDMRELAFIHICHEYVANSLSGYSQTDVTNSLSIMPYRVVGVVACNGVASILRDRKTRIMRNVNTYGQRKHLNKRTDTHRQAVHTLAHGNITKHKRSRSVLHNEKQTALLFNHCTHINGNMDGWRMRGVLARPCKRREAKNPLLQRPMRMLHLPCL